MITYLKLMAFVLFMIAAFGKPLAIEPSVQYFIGFMGWFVWLMTLILEKLDEIKDAILSFKKSYDGRFDGR